MRQEKLNFSIILRIGLSLLPILFGMSLPAMVWCSFNIAMSFIVFGPLTSVVSSLCAICISMFFCSAYGEGAMLDGLLLALEAIFCAMACVYTVAKRKDFFSGVWLAGLGFLVPSFAGLKHDATNAGLSIAHYLTDLPVEILKSQFELLSEQAGELDAELVTQVIDKVHEITIIVVPSVFVLVSLLVGYVVMWCVCARLRMLPIRVEHSFSEVKVPRTMVLAMVAVLLVCVFNFSELLNYVLLNILVILFYISAFAGVSLVDYYIRKFIKVAFLRVFLYFIAVMSFSAVIFAVFAVVAIIDSFFDFRKISKRRKSCETEG